MNKFIGTKLILLTALVVSTVCLAGTLVDKRDGKTYKTVTILGQEWMAENLNYNYNIGSAVSGCLRDKENMPECSFPLEEDSTAPHCKVAPYPIECDHLGRTYTWSAAMDSAALFSKDGAGCGSGKSCAALGYDAVVRGVCPEGWHLPKERDFSNLIEAIKREKKEKTGTLLTSCRESKPLKIPEFVSEDYSGGFIMEDRNSRSVKFVCDLVGFNYKDLGPDNYTFFWSSSNLYDEHDGLDEAFQVFVRTDDSGNFDEWTSNKRVGAAVRCIQDSFN